jgi:hypothetical protein
LRRSTILISLAGFLLTLSLPAAATDFDPWQMVFPLDGDHSSSYDNFGACRGSGCSRRHEGNDIMAAKGIPVLAVGHGVVAWISSPTALSSVHIGIDHGNGWFSRYIHLNNDTQNADGSYSDDGQEYGIAPGLVIGSEVEAGQLIGWVGDSGNAEGSASHLHFELRSNPNGGHGIAVNPNGYLLKAEHDWTGTFRDDDNSTHEANIEKIFAEGITFGCNPPLNTEFCPNRQITRGEMSAFIVRALDLHAASGSVLFDDVSGTTFENDIDKLMTAGIGFGCDENSFCPDQPLLRDEMAELLVRAFGYDNPDAVDFFGDDDGNRFEDSINKLANHRITRGCNPPDNDEFCPGRTLIRAEMATFFVRALGL